RATTQPHSLHWSLRTSAAPPVATSTRVSLSVSAVRPSGENATDLPPGVSVRSSLPVATSQSRRELSDSAVRPSGENATDWTVCDCPVKARIGLPLATSHSLSTASSPSDDQLPDNALRPSGEKATDVTEAKCAHCACGSELDSPVRRTIAGSQKLRSRLPVAISHSFTLLESPPDSAVRPSGEKATVLTARLSVEKSSNTLPVAESHSMTDPSPAPDKHVRPSGENAIA